MAADVFDRLVALLGEAKAKFRVIEHEAEGRSEVISVGKTGGMKLACQLRGSSRPSEIEARYRLLTAGLQRARRGPAAHRDGG